jgi:hypothetical protein
VKIIVFNNVKVIYLNCLRLIGRFDVTLLRFSRDECSHVVVPTLESIVGQGFWPSSPIISNGELTKAFVSHSLIVIVKYV